MLCCTYYYQLIIWRGRRWAGERASGRAGGRNTGAGRLYVTSSAVRELKQEGKLVPIIDLALTERESKDYVYVWLVYKLIKMFTTVVLKWPSVQRNGHSRTHPELTRRDVT